MSQLYCMPHMISENSENKILPAKQFGVSNNQLVRKKALVDVGNTLHLNSSQHNQKPYGSTSKPNIKEKKVLQLFKGDENKYSDGHMIKQDKKTHSVVRRESVGGIDKENVEPVCFCRDEQEDDYGDFMFKNIRLTSSQIDELALNLENPSTFSAQDMREIGDPNAFAIPEPEFDFLSLSLKSLLSNTSEDMELPKNLKIEPPVYFEVLTDDDYSSVVGL